MKINIDFVETTKVNMDEFTLIEGFPGMGLVGTIACKYLVEKLGFKMVGFIDSDSFVPIIRIHEGKPLHPSRIYVSEKHKLCVIISEQVIPKQYTYQIVNAIVDWVKYKGIKRIVSLAGIGTGGKIAEQSIKLYGMASNDESQKWLSKYGVEPIKEGITTGVTALLLLSLKESEGIEAISILSTVKMGADYKASAELLKKLNEVMQLNLDVNPLLKEAKDIEKQLVEQIKRLKATHDTVNNIETQTPMYT